MTSAISTIAELKPRGLAMTSIPSFTDLDFAAEMDALFAFCI